MISVALTGHRPSRLGLTNDELSNEWIPISRWIMEVWDDIHSKYGKVNLYCGMASGCDIKFALTLMNCVDTKLHCILPCKGYNSTHQYYNIIKQCAFEWNELSDTYFKGCDDVRDEYMVNHCDILLAIWDGKKSGGVWSTIQKAEKAGKKIIFISKEIIGRR